MTTPPGQRHPLLADRPPSPLREVTDDRFTRHGVRLLLKRDDLVHPELPGNKWRKLRPVLTEALTRGHHTLLTFGGAWSNHLTATATAGRELGLDTVGVVRGEELADRPLNPSLAACVAAGMRLRFVSRADYRTLRDPAAAERLRRELGACLVVPEGGSCAAAVRGCVALGGELAAAADPPDVVAVACGTGGTLAGLAAGLGPDQRALGVPVVRGGFLPDAVRGLQDAAFGGPRGRWEVVDGYQHGGFARTSPALTAFATDFADRHGLPELEPVYVARLLYALTDLTARGRFAAGTTMAAVVTG